MTPLSSNYQEFFLKMLLKQAWFADDQANLLKEDLRPILQERIILSIFSRLDEEQQTFAEQLLDQGEHTKLDDFFEKSIPNFEDFVNDIYVHFAEEYLANFKNNS